MSAAPKFVPEPKGAPMTIEFDQRSNFAAIPNLVGPHPGASMLKGWITQRLAPLAIRKRLKPGWHIRIDELAGALVDAKGKDLISFTIRPGYHL